MGTFPDFYRTLQAVLPQIQNSQGIRGLNILEGSKASTGVLNALQNPRNTSQSFRQVFGSNDINIAKYKYQQRRILADINGALPASFCTGGDEVTWISGEKTLTKTAHSSIFIKDTDLLSIDASRPAGPGSFRAFFEDQIRLMWNAFTGTIEKDAIAEFDAQRGVHVSTGLSTPISAQGFSNYAQFIANPAFRRTLKNEFRKQEYQGDLFVIGDEILRDYVESSVQPVREVTGTQLNGTAQQTVNDAGQLLPQNVNGMLCYDSMFVDSDLASNNVIAFEPGAFQMLEANRYARPELRQNNGTEITDTMLISYGGVSLLCDIKMVREYCDSGAEGWRMHLIKKYDFWAFPTADAFQATDPLFGANKLARFLMTTA